MNGTAWEKPKHCSDVLVAKFLKQTIKKVLMSKF
jgi:hypothetical protein